MPWDTPFQDYWLTDPNFKLWIRKSDDKTALYLLPKEYWLTNGGERVRLIDMQD